MDSIKERIKKLRKDNKLTQDRFGELCGVTKSAVSQWESGGTAPDPAKLLLLRDHLAFSIDYILTGKPDYNAASNQLPLAAKEQSPYFSRPLVQQIAELAERIDDTGLLKLHGYAACVLTEHPMIKPKRQSSA